MPIEIRKFTWTSPSRPCRFCLNLQGDSVFADFDVDIDERVFLVRISFDGYGCCTPDENIQKMSRVDSRTLIDLIEADDVNCDEVRGILRRYFQENRDCIWQDALEKHGLVQN